MSESKYLLLSGSPRGRSATSYALLHYLGKQLMVTDIEEQLVILSTALRDNAAFTSLLSRIDHADYIILALPLYVDSLPSHVIQFLTRIKEHRRNASSSSSPKFVVMVNSGFPEHSHNELALSILQVFSNEVGFQWISGIPIGGGQILHGSPLESSGGRGRNAREGLSLLAEAIKNNQPVPNEIIQKIQKPIIPRWLYLFMAGFGWRIRARKNGISRYVRDRPYVERYG